MPEQAAGVGDLSLLVLDGLAELANGFLKGARFLSDRIKIVVSDSIGKSGPPGTGSMGHWTS